MSGMTSTANPDQSTTTDHNIWPGITSSDPRALRAWLVSVGFVEGILVPGEDDLVQHSEMRWPEGGRVMVHSQTRDGQEFTVPVGSGSFYVVTDHPERVVAAAQALGAELVRPMEDTDYGSTGFTVRDPEGNVWSFGTYAG